MRLLRINKFKRRRLLAAAIVTSLTLLALTSCFAKAPDEPWVKAYKPNATYGEIVDAADDEYLLYELQVYEAGSMTIISRGDLTDEEKNRDYHLFESANGKRIYCFYTTREIGKKIPEGDSLRLYVASKGQIGHSSPIAGGAVTEYLYISVQRYAASDGTVHTLADIGDDGLTSRERTSLEE